MRTTLKPRCTQRRRAVRQQPIKSWAAAVVADPAAHHATEREARIVAALLAELEVA